MTVSDIAGLDLAYAPPFSSAKDPVIMAAMAAENVVTGVIDLVHDTGVTMSSDAGLLDVRRPDEVANGMLDGAVNIPLDELRERWHELDQSKHWVVYCRSGQRSYFATQLLKGVGFKRISNLSGGYIVQEMKQYVRDYQKQEVVQHEEEAQALTS